MAGQKINVKLAEKQFQFTVADQEQESIIRHAAERINKAIDGLSKRFPTLSMQDKISIVALNECSNNIAGGQKIEEMKRDEESLLRDLKNYLDNIETK